MSVRLSLRRYAADGRPKGNAEMTAETLAVLDEYRNVLEELIRVDLAHGWGYEAAFNDRLERATKLRDALAPVN